MTTPDLATSYLGLSLKNPLVPSASPLGRSLDNLRHMEDAGAGAVVLPSLFEEQIVHESDELDHLLSHGTYSMAEALTFFPEPVTFELAPDKYLNLVRRASESLDIPVIASLNGTSAGAWLDYAAMIVDAGASALELNLYSLPTNPFCSAVAIEDDLVDALRALKAHAHVPVAVKLSPYWTNLSGVARRLDDAGADGLVLFNRFQQPDIDLELMEVVTSPTLSPPGDQHTLRLPLCWIGLLFGHVRASLAASSGIHSAEDVLKLLLVGADVTMLASELMLRGIDRLRALQLELVLWLVQHEYSSISQLRGSFSQRHASFPATFERVHYVRTVSGLA